MAKTTTRIDATHNGYTLVTYHTSGESRVEHAESQTCSAWLHHTAHAQIVADPSLMAAWSTDEPMGESVDG